MLECQARVCASTSGRRVTEPFESCFADVAAGEALCDRAVRKARALGMLAASPSTRRPPAVHVCVRTLVRGGSGSSRARTAGEPDPSWLWLRSATLGGTGTGAGTGTARHFV